MTARFALKRFASALGVLFVVSVLTFLIFEVIPNGNPALRMAGRTATPADIAAVDREYGFNRPIYVQYLKTMEQLFTGKITSSTQHVNVLSQIRADLPVTISLVVGAFVIWCALGLLLGLAAGYKAGTTIDTLVTTISFTAISVPVFVVGYIVIFLFSFKTHLLPSSGYVGLGDPLGWADHLVLPWFSLSILYAGIYAQVLRANVVTTRGEDFVRTARAKGLPRMRIATHHVLRTSLIPVVALGALDLASVIGGGTILVETVFDLPGIGNYAATSIASLDEPPLLVITMLGAFAVVLLSALADITYTALDPRVRLRTP